MIFSDVLDDSRVVTNIFEALSQEGLVKSKHGFKFDAERHLHLVVDHGAGDDVEKLIRD